MKGIKTLVLATALAAATGVSAQQTAAPLHPWYVGVGIGTGVLHKSGSDLSGLDNAQLDDTDTTYTVRGGYRFSPYFAAELGYYDLGRYRFSGANGLDGSGRAQSVGISLVGIIPIDRFDLYGRIGYAHSKLTVNANGLLGSTANQNERQDEATYGLGARWNFAPQWGLFAEWMKNDRIRVDSYMGGIDFRF